VQRGGTGTTGLVSLSQIFTQSSVTNEHASISSQSGSNS